MSKMIFLGAAQTVTGSRTLIEHRGFRLLVDCGLFQGPKEIRSNNWLPFPEADQLDAVVLTHAHIDHSGFLPRLINDGFRGKIFCTEGTFSLAKIMLPDSGRLQEEDAEFANKSRYSHRFPALPLYTEKDAFACLRHFSTLESDKWHSLSADLSVKFLDAGHILGASIVQLSLADEQGVKIITFSGDIGNGRSVLMHNPTPITSSDFLVLESTYGDRMQPRSDPADQLAEVISRVVGRGGTLIIPAFAVGRTQEILYLIKQLEDLGKLPKYPVFLDSPMAKQATEVYTRHLADLKVKDTLEPSRLYYAKSADESMLLCMDDTPKIVVSAAGMLSGGRVLHHLKNKLPDPNNGVLFVGYQVAGTKGYLLKNGLKKIRLHHQEVEVNAEIFSLDSLSAHADSEDLLDWARHFQPPPRQTFLNHGEKNALETLKYRLINELQWSTVVIPNQNETFNL